MSNFSPLTAFTGGSSKNQVFLALTALEEFWDITKPIIFLGHWCRRYSRRRFWEPLGGEVLSHPWDDRRKFREAYSYLHQAYKRILPYLAEALNQSHGVSFSKRYWQIVVGPWLMLYVPIIYEKYITLQKAEELYPGFETIGLAEESCVLTSTTLDFTSVLTGTTYFTRSITEGDAFNLQMYTKLLAVLGKPMARKPLKIEQNQESTRKINALAVLKKIARKYRLALERAGQHKNAILFRSSYFPPAMEIRLALKTKGKARTFTREPVSLPYFPIDIQARNIIKNSLPADDQFASILREMLPFDLPQCYVEGYQDLKEEVEQYYPHQPKAIATANAWFFDEGFKQWAASSAEEGTLLLGGQHGGNYGSLLYMPPCEVHEMEIADRFYSWGWEWTSGTAEVVAMPAPKLVGLKASGADNRKNGIAFVATAWPRYFFRYPVSIGQFHNYLEWQVRFARSLKPEVRDRMRVRLYSEDYGWDIAKRWNDLFPEVAVEDPVKVSFWKSLYSCRLYVSDHLSTTFVEALAANKPSVLFWNPDENELREEAQPYYDQLNEAGILYFEPESAARAVQAVYEDVESWWNEPFRQEARQGFCHRFARTSSINIKEWASELERLFIL